jgi:uncharacterized protein YecT (DUF1311 family)
MLTFCMSRWHAWATSVSKSVSIPSRCWFPLRLTIVSGLLTIILIASVTAAAQSAAIENGTAANREYAAVFAHSDNPCSADYATSPYMHCMSKELEFVELHLNAFVEDLRGLAGSPDELAALNKTDTAWRVYRESSCSLPLKRFSGGTIKGPMSADCQLNLDRAYMKQLSGIYILSQFPK